MTDSGKFPLDNIEVMDRFEFINKLLWLLALVVFCPILVNAQTGGTLVKGEVYASDG